MVPCEVILIITDFINKKEVEGNKEFLLLLFYTLALWRRLFFQ